jgi:hypothetical protein
VSDAGQVRRAATAPSSSQTGAAIRPRGPCLGPSAAHRPAARRGHARRPGRPSRASSPSEGLPDPDDLFHRENVVVVVVVRRGLHEALFVSR